MPPAHPTSTRARPTMGNASSIVISPIRRNKKIDENSGIIPTTIENPYPLLRIIGPSSISAAAPKIPANRRMSPILDSHNTSQSA